MYVIIVIIVMLGWIIVMQELPLSEPLSHSPIGAPGSVPLGWPASTVHHRRDMCKQLQDHLGSGRPGIFCSLH